MLNMLWDTNTCCFALSLDAIDPVQVSRRLHFGCRPYSECSLIAEHPPNILSRFQIDEPRQHNRNEIGEELRLQLLIQRNP